MKTYPLALGIGGLGSAVFRSSSGECTGLLLGVLSLHSAMPLVGAPGRRETQTKEKWASFDELFVFQGLCNS